MVRQQEYIDLHNGPQCIALKQWLRYDKAWTPPESKLHLSHNKDDVVLYLVTCERHITLFLSTPQHIRINNSRDIVQ